MVREGVTVFIQSPAPLAQILQGSWGTKDMFVSSFHEVYFMIYFLTMEKQIGNLQYETSHVLEASAIYTCESHVLFFSELHSQ